MTTLKTGQFLMRKQISLAQLLAVAVLISTSMIACDSNSNGSNDDSDTGNETASGNLSGVVQDAVTKTPLPGITVTLNLVETTTDQDGRFAFQDVSVGIRNLKATTTGYDTYDVRIQVQPGENTRDISLNRTYHYQLVSADGLPGNYDLYIPPGVSTIRGVIFLGNPSGVDTRGFASGNPMNSAFPGRDELIALDRARSLQLAEKYGLALMGSEGVFNERVTDTILAALEQFATESARPELAQAPLLMTGFSLGGCISYRFAQDRPERTIGFMSQKGGCHTSFGTSQSTRLVPGYLFIGGDDTDSRFDNISQLFEEHRSQGALWALAIEQGVDHFPVVDQTLLFNWADFILEARLPEAVAPGEPVVLKVIDEASGWLGHQQSFSTSDYGSYSEDKLKASWLPSMQTAQDWQTFVLFIPGKKGKPSRSTGGN